MLAGINNWKLNFQTRALREESGHKRGSLTTLGGPQRDSWALSLTRFSGSRQLDGVWPLGYLLGIMTSGTEGESRIRWAHGTAVQAGKAPAKSIRSLEHT